MRAGLQAAVLMLEVNHAEISASGFGVPVVTLALLSGAKYVEGT